ncbi:MAG: helix-turn-helix transcriptional regulator [Clostridia bacterium]|nr:helix-turn-helix transcriptional regulator [Clostridia bacterium]
MLLTERLKQARKECKLTQQQIADLLGVDRSTYAYYELGVSNPSLENILALAGIFKVDIEWLLGAEKSEDTFHSPDSELSLMRAVKEKDMSALSKDERRIVALYRIAGVYGKQADIFAALKEIAVSDDGDDEDE